MLKHKMRTGGGTFNDEIQRIICNSEYNVLRI